MDEWLYIIDGEEVKKASYLEEWNRWMAENNAIVSYDSIEDIVVCTAFVGRDFALPSRENPLLFRTDIWIVDHAYQCAARTETLAEAQKLHRGVLGEVIKRRHQALVMAEAEVRRIMKGIN